MATFEMLIVFGAFVAIIALVAIAIDWVGKPLRNRRFIPRIYRYDDEILPSAFPAGPPVLPQTPPQQPMVIVSPPAAQAPPRPVAVVHPDLRSPVAPLDAPQPVAARATIAPGNGAPSSAFSDLVEKTTDEVTASAATAGAAAPPAEPAGADAPKRHDHVAEAGTLVRSIGAWTPGMSLDAHVDERKPTPAVKAERFWKTVAAAAASSASHFGYEDCVRMSEGRAPRRRNPRTGNTETMQLAGLRRASDDSGVRMKWPDESVDPWSGR